MLATGQVAMCNHTFSHADLRHVDAARKRDEIDRNERWIERTFGVTARPYLRPPYGATTRPCSRRRELPGSPGS